MRKREKECKRRAEILKYSKCIVCAVPWMPHRSLIATAQTKVYAYRGGGETKERCWGREERGRTGEGGAMMNNIRNAGS